MSNLIDMSNSREEKMKRNIMVVQSSDLYDKNTPLWFLDKDYAKRFLEIILEKHEFKQRWPMEEDTSWQQPIPYVLLYNPQLKKYVGYKRSSKTEKYWENRLYGKWSLWVGGHIEEDEKNSPNPIEETARREIEEEIWLTKDTISGMQLLWAIRDHSTDVARHHIWFVYLAQTNIDLVEIVDWELEKVFFLSADEIDEILNDDSAEMESRSQLVWESIN